MTDDFSNTSDTLEIDGCLREAGAGGSNPLTPTIQYRHNPREYEELTNTYEDSLESFDKPFGKKFQHYDELYDGEFIAPDFQHLVAENFWSKVFHSPHLPPEFCWPWKGGTSAHGYGRYKLEGRLYSAHRIAWMLTFGPIPRIDEYHGAVVMHRCDNPSCCRPSHLFLGTQKENVADQIRKGRHPRRGGRPKGITTARRFQKKSARKVKDYNISNNALQKMASSKLSNHYWAMKLNIPEVDIREIRRKL